MKNVKKVIAGVAAVAALIAVPTASAFAESVSDADASSVAYDVSSTHLLTALEVDNYAVSIEDAVSEAGAAIEVDDLDAITGYITGFTTAVNGIKEVPYYMTLVSGDDAYKTYSLTLTADGVTETYTVTFTAAVSAASHLLTALEVDNYAVSIEDAVSEAGAAIEVDDLDAITGYITSFTASWGASDPGYYMTLVDEGDGYKTYSLTVSSTISDFTETYKVTFTAADDEGTTPEEPGDGDGDDTTTPEEPGDDDATGDDDTTTEPGDEGNADDDTTDDAVDAGDSSDDDANGNGNTESNTLAQTGSVLAGVGVFALLALLGSAVVFVVRKRV